MLQTSLVLLIAFISLQISLRTSALPHPVKMQPEIFLPRKVLIAVIDTGVDITHPDLRHSIWRNQKETENALDDDRNGFTDDLLGWNFVQNNADIRDQHGHGTHIAGIIAKNPQAQLMVLKALDVQQSGEAAIEATVKAIYYAINKKVDIINYSGGGTMAHPRERRALEIAEKSGILVVAAAGNLKSNMDREGFYPAHYPLKNIISVAAVNQKDELLQSSNYGPNSVSVAASGQDIVSALPHALRGKMSGTSQATAKVTRVLASLITKAQNPMQSLLQQGRLNKRLAGKIKNPVIIEDQFGN